MKYCIVLVDEQDTLLNVIGPFEEYNEAQDYADEYVPRIDYEILELELPINY